ncbi:hypothetical protein MMYC01_204124 [Madurella mycetomatis]|uniref:Uncharacterized protein n=1 Tax=Madurella mycetomatis TaxID=100816 RepID=A0A175WA36_9PEZI|nr:hypothetical protein MMYC01_204124 [Madurella mycetomatis]
MEKAGSFATPPAWATWAPNKFTSYIKIQRRYVQIPLDQRGLLEDRDAWAPSGSLNVPPQVLDDVWARYIKTTRPSPEAVKEASSPPPSSAHQDYEHSTPKEPPAEAGRGSDAEEDLESETNLSCPSQHSSMTKRSRAVSTAAHRAVYLTEFPPSGSLASETGLEVEVPGAITDIIETVNREAVAALEPTPPSAQIIPYTLTATTSPVRTPKAKRQRLMKHPRSVWQSSDDINHEQAEKLGSRKTSSALLSRSPNQMISSSSLVAKDPVPLPAEDGRPSQADTKPETFATAPQRVAHQGSSNATDEIPPNGPPSQVPFTAFKMEYPDYDASLGDFIRGVMCVLRIHKDRALPSFLYDDFIRVFSSDYVEYVSSVDGKEPTLPAVQWYNENVSRPLYSKGILNKNNINDILSHYPDKVRAIRQKLVASETNIEDREGPTCPVAMGGYERAGQQTPSMIEAPCLSDDPYTSRGAVLAETSPPISRAELPSDTVHTTERFRTTDEAHMTAIADMSGIVSARQPSVDMARSAGSALAADDIESDLGSLQSQIDLPFPIIEKSPTPQRTSAGTGMQRSVGGSSSAMLTQQSNPESIAEPTLKRKARPAGERSASYKKPARTKQDFRKRVKEFLTQHRATQSSAPRSSAES